jgi:hypothetical protein
MHYNLELEPPRFNLTGAEVTTRDQPYFPAIYPYNLARLAAVFDSKGVANPVIDAAEAAYPRCKELRIPKGRARIR